MSADLPHRLASAGDFVPDIFCAPITIKVRLSLTNAQHQKNSWHVQCGTQKPGESPVMSIDDVMATKAPLNAATYCFCTLKAAGSWSRLAHALQKTRYADY